MLVRWSAATLVRGYVATLGCWYADTGFLDAAWRCYTMLYAAIRWYAGMLVCCCTGTLLRWYNGPTGVAQNAGHYLRQHWKSVSSSQDFWNHGSRIFKHHRNPQKSTETKIPGSAPIIKSQGWSLKCPKSGYLFANLCLLQGKSEYRSLL